MASRQAHTVAAVVYNGLCTFEFGAAVEVFGQSRPELGVDWYRFVVCHAEPGPVTAVGGVTVQGESGLEAVEEAGTIVVPGWRDPAELPPGDLLAALTAAHQRGARLVALCSGAFVLAAAGVLDDRRATTHWRYLDDLMARYPAITVEDNILYVDDGNVFTSAGSAAAIDLCLYLVRQDFGSDIAAQVARRLVVSPYREGGQAQYVPHVFSPRPQAPSMAEVMEWALGRLDRDLTVTDLARTAMLAPRTFARRFREETGTTPHHWLTRQRLREAQRLLETTTESVEWIARATGLRTAETLRHHFRSAFGTTPTSYRRRFAPLS